MPSSDYYQISQGKSIRFPFMKPLYLRCAVPYSMGLLFVMQHLPLRPALYTVPVRRLECLPPASFRFVVTYDTLALG